MAIVFRKRMLVASLTTAVLASSSLADAQVIHSLGTSPFVRTPLAGRQFGVRPFTNPTTRTTFVSGGATLPAIAYLGLPNAISGNPELGTSTSIFGYFHTLSGVNTQYCQTGSGFGKRVFDGDKVKTTGGVNGPCAALGVSPGSTNGFGAPSSLGLTDPDITGSDSPLTQSEYTNFVNNKGATRGEAVEFPSIVGSVALMYNDPDLGATKLNLSDTLICELAEGKITNWSQLGQKSRPLTFVYRADGSGTTFSFSNHLLAVCGTGSGLNTSQNFAPSASGTPPYVNPNPPSNFVGESGNAGVANYIATFKVGTGTSAPIGYVEAANAAALVKGAVQYADVNFKDPIKDLPQTAAALKYNSGTIAPDSAVVTNGGAATTAALTGVKKAGCVQLVKPSAYAHLTQGYPIVAVTNFLFSSNGNGATNASHLRTLVSEVNTPSLFGTKILTVNPPSTSSGKGTTGFAALDTSFNQPLVNAAAACVGT